MNRDQSALVFSCALCVFVSLGLPLTTFAATTLPAKVAADTWYGLPPAVAAALIGAISALATAVVIAAIKDFLIPRVFARNERLRTQNDVIRLYVGPLADSIEKIIWRFKELFLEGRHHFLATETAPFEFNSYKRISTLYRIACLLGWMRAIDRELNALPKTSHGLTNKFYDSLREVRETLADGSKVEVLRLDLICAIWSLPLPEQKKDLANRLEVYIYKSISKKLNLDSKFLQKISVLETINISTGIVRFLCDELRILPPEMGDRDKLHDTVQAISFRQALIYRDWQDAIGDAMLIATPDSSRNYSIRSYDEFCISIDNTDKPWLTVFSGLVDDVNFDEIDPKDFRYIQLRNFARSISLAYLALADGKQSDLLRPKAISAARELSRL